MAEKNILIVDDDPSVIVALSHILRAEPYEVLSAESAEEALQLLEKQEVQLIVSDENMPGMNGSELLSIVRRQYPDIVRILLTGKASMESTMKAVNEGEIYRFFTKPWDKVDLTLSIRHGLEKYALEAERKVLIETVQKQRKDLSLLEEKFPGITRVERDKDDAIVCNEMSDDEMTELLGWCQEKCKEEQEED